MAALLHVCIQPFQCLIGDRIQRRNDNETILGQSLISRLHFNDQSYFTKVFKKYTGITPKKFRHDRGIT
ncbi:AraC family transcriptional regulator [Paenibacillus sonchi]|uniref:AraC family transcriptional regulator n=1 Tax=Paenibacillus sonchi TaxID=373687 RepID=A0A974P898_9BACL|nr:AraC family transcriptional regulator [Paenibacillus sonchi]QQZ58608.1 AraC family transcriptional regulator [Paenibacillus sonchi]